MPPRARRTLIDVLAGLSPVSRYIVEGTSMEPAYHAGDRVLVNRLALRRRAPRTGDVVVLRDPEDGRRFLLKRIADSPDGLPPAPGYVHVLGDNPAESRDSRDFGPVALRHIVGTAWMKY
jgi:signal peptidase I